MQDHTGQQWLTSFEESGHQIMGMTAQELKELEGSPAFDSAVQARTTLPISPCFQ